MYTKTAILLLATLMPCGFSCTRSNSNMETINNMEQQVYTLGAWRIQKGRTQEFITAWKELGEIFSALPDPPSGKGVLIQSTLDSTLFYSFGPWESLDAIEAMREDQRAQEGIRKLVDLCTEATPGSFRVVAESP